MTLPVCAIVGVGPGLGLSLAQKFGRQGYALALLARQPEALREYAATLTQEGLTASVFPVDAADPQSLTTAFGHIQETLGAPSVLIYNAAALRQGGVLSVTPETLIAEFKVNVAGALTAIQQVVPEMKRQGQGTILLTGGGLAYYPNPQYVSLGIGKAGLRSLALSSAQELEADGIHVATVTVSGLVRPGTHFDPDLIAEAYWTLHQQPRGAWTQETVYD